MLKSLHETLIMKGLYCFGGLRASITALETIMGSFKNAVAHRIFEFYNPPWVDVHHLLFYHQFKDRI